MRKRPGHAGIERKGRRVLNGGHYRERRWGPDYVLEQQPRVSHMWWHIQGKGWMAHDFLVPL